MSETSESPLTSPATKSALVAVLDTLIPARPDGLPGAGSLGVVDYVTERISGLDALMLGALEALDALAVEHGAASFAAVAAEDRQALVETVAPTHPGFLESLIFHTYTGYYQEPRVLEALGLEARPPHPKGFEMEMGDLGLLDAVRARGAKYRT